MPSRPTVVVIPLLGAFHARYPQYTVVHVRETVRAARPDALAVTPLAPGALARPAWQDTDEVALPHTVVPWARNASVPIHEVGFDTGAADAPGGPDAAGEWERFRSYLEAFDAGRERLRRVDAALEPVREILAGALDAAAVRTRLLPAIRAYQAERAAVLEEGPGTGWLADHAERLAERIAALPHDRVAVLAGVDHVAALEDALERRCRLEPTPELPTDLGPEGRERALLDTAMRGDVADPAALLERLREVPRPEARYHEANLLLLHGHAAEALERLEAASREDFQEPYYLPGFLLARLGQLYDVSGRREAALRAYRGVLALSFAPAEAVQAAQAGLLHAFRLPDADV